MRTLVLLKKLSGISKVKYGDTRTTRVPTGNLLKSIRDNSSVFEENNHLWKIILHFGDMRKWDSLEDLFDHLLHTSDDSYSVSLRKLYNLLL